MIPVWLSFQYEVIPGPSCDSVLVYMTPVQKLMSKRVTPVRLHNGTKAHTGITKQPRAQGVSSSRLLEQETRRGRGYGKVTANSSLHILLILTISFQKQTHSTLKTFLCKRIIKFSSRNRTYVAPVMRSHVPTPVF